MKLTFLGTGTSQGVPIIACQCNVCQSTDSHDKRLRASVLIEDNGTNIVIDAGPDFRQQMLTARLKTLDAILLTHEHRDHIAGIDDVRAFNYLMNQPMDIWAEKRVHDALRSEFTYIFAESKYPGIPEVVMHTIDGNPIQVKGIEAIPVRAYHRDLPVYGFRIGDIAYITDANYIPEEEKEKIKGVKYLIINALRKKKHVSHFSLPEVILLAEELNPEIMFITHISHQMGLHVDIQAELPPNIFLAYDGLILDV